MTGKIRRAQGSRLGAGSLGRLLGLHLGLRCCGLLSVALCSTGGQLFELFAHVRPSRRTALWRLQAQGVGYTHRF